MARDAGGTRSSGLLELELPKELSLTLGAGHPWIYRDRLAKTALPKRASWVRVRAGGFRAFALYDPESPIALRVYSRDQAPDRAWFQRRVSDALALREPLRRTGTTAFRLLNGEGDGVPGLVADVYERFVVVSTYAGAVGELVVPAVVEAVAALLGPHGIVLRQRQVAGQSERTGEAGAKPPKLRVLSGREPPAELVVQEGDMRLIADLHHGQKTGLFLDHRDNRTFVRREAAGCRVLNLFSYTGAFSVSAALGGAAAVTSVDIAPGAVAAARDNFELNALDASSHEFVTADVFEFAEAAKTAKKSFELVVCDPPSFANSREQSYAAQRAYLRVNALGVALTAPGGMYAAASCTAQVSPAAFREILAEAAARAGKRLQIVHEAGQARDHPYAAGHPEGRYLKFVVGRVLPRV
jgi:23S rRNA (cytosine1962-C5)-methyltransferase